MSPILLSTRLLVLAFFLVFSLSGVSPALAQTKWKTLEQLQRAADEGNAEAQKKLAFSHMRGEYGLPRDRRKGMKWLEKAAEQDGDAQLTLGMLYALAEDNRKAMKWFEKAADNGYAEARDWIETLAAIERDRRKPLPPAETPEQQKAKQVQKAAIEGDAEAQAELGLMYMTGRYAPMDNRMAVAWLQKAVDQGNARAQRDLGVMYERGRGVPQDERKAAELYLKAAEQGDIHAQNNLGGMYLGGRGVSGDARKAEAWYLKAADQGSPIAQYNLGLMHEEGEDIPKDERKAAEWYQKAADQGFVHGQLQLGTMYYEGRGVPQDTQKACALWRLAAAQKNMGPVDLSRCPPEN